MLPCSFFIMMIIYRSITEFHKIKVNVKPNVIIFPQGLAHLGVWQLPIFLHIPQRQAAHGALFSFLTLLNLAINRKECRKQGRQNQSAELRFPKHPWCKLIRSLWSFLGGNSQLSIGAVESIIQPSPFHSHISTTPWKMFCRKLVKMCPKVLIGLHNRMSIWNWLFIPNFDLVAINCHNGCFLF